MSIEALRKAHAANCPPRFVIAATAEAAIQRGKNIKHWSRDWKLQLIEKTNPDWRDLYDEICG